METKATLRGVRLSAQKGRLVADQIRGLPVDRRSTSSRSARRRARGSSRRCSSRRSPTPSTTTAPTSTSSRSRRSTSTRPTTLRRFTRARQGPRQRDRQADLPHPRRRRRRQIRNRPWDRKSIRPVSALPSTGTGLEVVREQQELRADAGRGHQGPRVPEEEAVARVGGQGHDRASGEERAHHDPQRASRCRHRQEGRGHRDAARRPAQDDGRRRRPQHRGDPQARDRRAADRRLDRAAAREADHVPPRDEARDAERDAPRRAGHQGHVRRAA